MSTELLDIVECWWLGVAKLLDPYFKEYEEVYRGMRSRIDPERDAVLLAKLLPFDREREIFAFRSSLAEKDVYERRILQILQDAVAQTSDFFSVSAYALEKLAKTLEQYVGRRRKDARFPTIELKVPRLPSPSFEADLTPREIEDLQEYLDEVGCEIPMEDIRRNFGKFLEIAESNDEVRRQAVYCIFSELFYPGSSAELSRLVQSSGALYDLLLHPVWGIKDFGFELLPESHASTDAVFCMVNAIPSWATHGNVLPGINTYINRFKASVRKALRELALEIKGGYRMYLLAIALQLRVIR